MPSLEDPREDGLLSREDMSRVLRSLEGGWHVSSKETNSLIFSCLCCAVISRVNLINACLTCVKYDVIPRRLLATVVVIEPVVISLRDIFVNLTVTEVLNGFISFARIWLSKRNELC